MIVCLVGLLLAYNKGLNIIHKNKMHEHLYYLRIYHLILWVTTLEILGKVENLPDWIELKAGAPGCSCWCSYSLCTWDKNIIQERALILLFSLHNFPHSGTTSQPPMHHTHLLRQNEVGGMEEKGISAVVVVRTLGKWSLSQWPCNAMFPSLSDAPWNLRSTLWSYFLGDSWWKK